MKMGRGGDGMRHMRAPACACVLTCVLEWVGVRAQVQGKIYEGTILLYESPPAETRLTVYRRLLLKIH